MSNNMILNSDSYKYSHHKQYPPKTETIYSYFESRKGAKWDTTTFFGLQYFLKKYLTRRITYDDIGEAWDLIGKHLGHRDLFNKDGWYHIANEHDGYLPLEIKAIPEGSSIPTNNVLMTVENTDPKCYWLTNFVETLLVQTWYPSTVATQSREMKKVWLKYLEETGTPSEIDFKLHDFGFRGVTCPEQAGLGGAAHLVSWQGTDNIAGIVLARKYYDEEMAGFSIPASEHSTITAWGKENEKEAMRNMLRSYPESPIIACVSDSYDIWNACENIWGKELKEEIIKSGKTLVVRPDSGNPPSIVYNVIKTLMNQFGYQTNTKGYDVLPPYIRVIQGDGINFQMMNDILSFLKRCKISTDNLIMGSGGGLLQQLNRDTQKFAFKCSAAKIDGEWRDVWKDPVTDKDKWSKRGRLKLIKNDVERYETITKMDSKNFYPDELKTVFLNGKLTNQPTFAEIRERAKI